MSHEISTTITSAAATAPHCKALVAQGPRKNQLCRQPPLENGYCVHHVRNHEYEMTLHEGKKICGMFFRGCDNKLSAEDIAREYKNCETCRKKKSGKEYPCQYDGCVFMIEDKDEKYCKKHIRQHLRDNEEEKSIRYCDIARGCFGVIVSGNKCETCKEKERAIVSQELGKLRKQYGVQAADEEKLREMYPLCYRLQESKICSVSELWRAVQRNAYFCSLLFLLTQEDFEKLASQACYYCGFYSSTRLVSIDRVDNNKGYLPSNCIPSCRVCNMMKGGQHPIEFLDKIEAIHRYITTQTPIKQDTVHKWKHSYLSVWPRLSHKRYEATTKTRNMEFHLTEKEYIDLLKGDCYLCGLTNGKGHENGIDRMDASVQAYEMSNCRSCCGHCNIMKKELTYQEFTEKCKQIHDHGPNRDLFETVPIYSDQKCRKEAYTSDEIAVLMKNGSYMSYIEWCVEQRRTPEFIDAMNQLQHNNELAADLPRLVEAIRGELEKERNRRKTVEEQLQMKTINCRTLYSYLTQGKEEHFIKWYETHYNKSTLFHEKLRELLDQLPSLSHEKGITACQDFMYAEKNRRVSQQRRSDLKKVVKYAPTSEEMDEKESAAPAPIPAPTPMPTPVPSRPTLDPIVTKVTTQQNQVGYQKKTVENVKQWKSSMIHRAIQHDQENEYKAFCEENNDLSLLPNWSNDWATFVLSVKGKSEADALPLITAFVENLRRIRHNKLCFDKNASIVDKEDRQQWPATTVVRAFLDGKLAAFKTFTESYTNEDSADPKWVKRWTAFVDSLEKARDDQVAMKTLCSKFMTAQRTKKYRHSKAGTSGAGKSPAGAAAEEAEE